MKIYFISKDIKNLANKASGGGKSSETLLKYLTELGNDIKIFNSASELKSGIKSEKPDVVLHQNIQEMVRTQRICEKNDVPLVVTVNSFISCCTSMHITNRTKYGEPCYKCGFLKCFKCMFSGIKYAYPSMHLRIRDTLLTPAYYTIRGLRIRALNKADKVICISPTMKKMIGSAGVDTQKIEVIPQPVDPYFLNPPESNIFEGLDIAFISSAQWFKGAHLAAEAISKLNNIRLVIAGGKTKTGNYIKQILADRAIFVGMLSKGEMKKYYYSAHVVLFPSIWFEGYARAFSEAMMCGKPVVAFNNGRGATDYLIHEYNALISDFNVEAYAEQIKRLFEDEALYKRISKNAREYAKKNFLADVVARKYEKVFEEVVKK